MTAPALSPAALADACARWGVSDSDAARAIREVIDTGQPTPHTTCITYALDCGPVTRIVLVEFPAQQVQRAWLHHPGETPEGRILRLIRANPGRSLSNLHRRVRGHYASLRATVDALEASGHVRSEYTPEPGFEGTPARRLWATE